LPAKIDTIYANRNNIYYIMGGKMAETKITTIRLTASEKSKLKSIAQLDKTSASAVLKRLIRAEYESRREELKQFKNNLKNNENVSENEEIEDKQI
jgi:glycine betaine/choline ABC-type transport system substrate-binding protein